MIIELLLDALYGVFNLLTTPINIPSLPSEAHDMINQIFNYILSGAQIVVNYTNFSYLITLLGIIIGIDIGIAVYHFVMWVIRKIPMAGMS